jgi:peptide/nickel transport system substrate-binding protein
MRNTTAICLTLGSTFLAGCAADLACEGSCGTAVITTTGAPRTALPALAVSVPSQALGDLVFLPLAEIGNDLNYLTDDGFEPRIARRWSAEDSVTIVFELDDRATWQDGAPVTADDVVFTFDLYRDPIVNSVVREDLVAITAVTARDEHTVAFTFSHPYAEQFYDAAYHMRIHPRHILDTIPRSELAAHPFGRDPIGNGPFRVARWDASSTVELVADTTFFLGRPGLDRIVIQANPDLNGIVTSLVAGETDFTDFLGPLAFVNRIREAEHLTAIPTPSLVYMFLSFNFRDSDHPDRQHPLLSQRYIREAVSLAVDREAIAQATMADLAPVPQGPVSQANPLWELELPTIPYDTARARRLLADEGWTDSDGDGVLDRDGERLSFGVIIPPSGLRQQMATIMESQLGALGIELRIEQLADFDVWQSRSAEGRFESTLGGWEQDPNPLGSTRGTWGTNGPNNWGSYSNARLDTLLDALAQGLPADQARETWREALQVIQDDYPAIWLMSPVQAVAVHSRFENVTMRPGRWGSSIWRWRVPPDEMLPRDRIGIQ